MGVMTRRGVMHVQDDTGDTRVQWDPNKPEEVEGARRQFETLTKGGYLAYKVMAGGGKGEQIRDFDPSAEKIILAAPMAGGAGE